jgi:hypothetical protein
MSHAIVVDDLHFAWPDGLSFTVGPGRTALIGVNGTRQLAQALAAYRGALLVASHDLPFLRGAGITRVDRP